MHTYTTRSVSFHLKQSILFILMLAGLLFLSQKLHAQNLDESLLLHYTFDTIEDGFIIDVSGNGKHCSLYGSAGLTEGWSGNALEFPGAEDFALLPNNINANLTDFSIALWIKGNASWNTWSRVFDFGSGTAYNMFFTPYAGNGTARFAIKNGGEEQIIDANGPLPYNEWVHFCLTVQYSGETGLGILYINGVESGRNENIGITPAMLSLDVVTNQNYLGKSQYNDPGLNAALDDFRIYNRILDLSEIALLNGFPQELMLQHQALDLGNISKISQDLNLPLILGEQGVQVSWSSSHPEIISSEGIVQQPQYYNATVILTATLSMEVNNKTYNLSKIFYATVLAINIPDELTARWNFDTEKLSVDGNRLLVMDASKSRFTGECMNRARIITIGDNPRFNVLDLGNANGYFDMGTPIGQAIYALEDYSMGVFFRVNENYTNLSAYGNWIWNFSNSEQLGTDANGALWGALRSQQQTICRTHYNTEQTVQRGSPAQQGSWHHMAATYNKSTQTATLYIDGVPVATNNQVSYTCTSALTLSGRNGTLYNWLGRSCYAGDAYLAQTLLYDFQLYRVALTGTELNDNYNIQATLEALNSAYAQNPDYHNPNLPLEYEALNLEDLEALEHNLILPLNGQIDPGIVISWSSSHPDIISVDGVVQRPDYVDFRVSLTATLRSGGDFLVKTFQILVKASEETSYQSDLLLHHDFSSVVDNLVKDQAEMHFEAVLRNEAQIRQIGQDENVFSILDLGDKQGYLDLGKNIGKIMVSLSDFSISCYYRIDKGYQYLNWNGNCLWNFSNSDNLYNTANGFMSAFLNNQGYYISAGNWLEEQTMTTGKMAGKDAWHHLAYTQQNQTGILYLDGIALKTGQISALPFNTLQKIGLTGTTCNWIGRSAYAEDVYLQNTLVYDFRLYNRALSASEISDSLLDVRNTLQALDLAYLQTSSSLNVPLNKQAFSLYSGADKLMLCGLQAGDHIRILSLLGSNINLLRAEGNCTTLAIADYTPGLYLILVLRNGNCIWTTKTFIPNQAP